MARLLPTLSPVSADRSRSPRLGRQRVRPAGLAEAADQLGLLSLSEGPAREERGADPYGYLRKSWDEEYQRAVARYRPIRL